MKRTLALVYNEEAEPLRDCDIASQIQRLINSLSNPVAGWGTMEYHYSNFLFFLAMRVYLLEHPEYREHFSFEAVHDYQRKVVEMDSAMIVSAECADFMPDRYNAADDRLIDLQLLVWLDDKVGSV